MSNRKEKLALLLKLNKQKEDEAKEQLTKTRKIIDYKKSQIITLEGHKSRMLDEQSGVSVPVLYNNFIKFMQKIDLAISEENQRIHLLEDQFQGYHRTYIAFNQKVKTIEKLIEKIETEERIVIERKNQKQMDEMVQRRNLSDDRK